MIRGQKLGQWHRTKTYSSLVTGRFELYAERGRRNWLACVDVADSWTGDDERPLERLAQSVATSRLEAETEARRLALDLAAELTAAAAPQPMPVSHDEAAKLPDATKIRVLWRGDTKPQEYMIGVDHLGGRRIMHDDPMGPRQFVGWIGGTEWIEVLPPVVTPSEAPSGAA